MSNIEKQVEELKTMLDNNEDFILLDVRTENEVLVSKISDKSIHIPITYTFTYILNPFSPVILYTLHRNQNDYIVYQDNL